jgi:hypothetical protein
MKRLPTRLDTEWRDFLAAALSYYQNQDYATYTAWIRGARYPYHRVARAIQSILLRGS